MQGLIPTRCLLCLSWTRIGICQSCQRAHTRSPQDCPRCPGCAIRLPLGVQRCASCARCPPPQAWTCAAVDYEHPWDRVLLSLKFAGQPQLARMLAPIMAAAVLAQPAAAPRPSHRLRVVPMPLSRQRIGARGYNQAWELARHVAGWLGLRARADVLQRAVHLPGQAEQERHARLSRMRGVFVVPPLGRAWIAGHTIALVDDVVTTGATAAEAVRALEAAGAAAVVVWAFARTGEPQGPA